jgi:uncharacterized repeat protein (TIGR03806 family)
MVPVDAGTVSGSLGCSGLPRPTERYRLVDPFPRLPPFVGPVAAYQPVGDSQWWYVIEQRGLVKRFPNRPDAETATTVLDLSGQVDAEFDAGLLALAFHPRFASNGQVFVAYTLPQATGVLSRLARFRSRDGGATLEAAGEVILDLPQPGPEKEHLTCDMHFGPDGYLYLAFGDGGLEEDDTGLAAQNLMELPGKFLRIDVDRTGPAGQPYAVPPDNPFVGQAARPEIWALGFRNPWRWRFHPETGDIWAGDVGADTREEIDRVVKGGNYGWGLVEGTLCRRPPCVAAQPVIAPVLEYGHDEGKSVTAGLFYRGAALPTLTGRFLYADFVSGHVWALPANAAPSPELILDSQRAVVSFAEASDGEFLLVDHIGGRLHALGTAAGEADEFPRRLSQTGCFEGARLERPAPGLVPYEVNSPLWSDGGSKERWLALPAGGRITVLADGDFTFPPGTTLVKQFSLAGSRTETRLFVRHADGGWAGYSYAWDEQQADAVLLPASSRPVERQVGQTTWHYPTRWQCLACHARDAGFALGLELSQLDRPQSGGDLPGRNQLAFMEALGLFTDKLPASPGALPAPDGSAPLAERARSYLHGNCAGCHRPGEVTAGGIDLRYTTPLAETGACAESSPGGNDDDITPVLTGKPEKSLLLRLMRSTAERRMPPIGRTVIDAAGSQLVEEWIRTLTSCQ